MNICKYPDAGSLEKMLHDRTQEDVRLRNQPFAELLRDVGLQERYFDLTSSLLDFLLQGGGDPYFIPILSRAKYRYEPGGLEEQVFSCDSEASLSYAKHLGGRFETGESRIAMSGYQSYMYAKLIGERFELGERAIARSANASAFYALEVIDGPFPPGEALIARHSGAVLAYIMAIKGRFKPGEDSIIIDGYAYAYIDRLKSLGVPTEGFVSFATRFGPALNVLKFYGDELYSFYETCRPLFQ